MNDAFVDRLTAYLDGQASHDAEALRHEDTDLAMLASQLRAPASWNEPPAGLRDAILNRVRDRAATASAAATTASAAATTASAVATTAPAAAAAVPATTTPAAAAVPASTAPAAAAVPATTTPAAASTAPVPDRAAAPAQSPQARTGRPRRRPLWRRLTWAIPAAAVAAALFTAGIIAVDRALLTGPPAGETFTATGTQLAPDATATVVVSDNPSGFSLRIQATGLPAAAPGSYYSAWLHGPRGVVPLGSFHQHRSGSSVALWSGVDPKDYTTLVITLQAEGEPPNMSDLVVMTATLRR
jgi:hypothetical protein